MKSALNPPGPLIVLGVDAGDLGLIDRWTRDGTLPNLQAVREAGVWASLDGIRDFNSFSVWPSFATGATASDHGYYSHMQLAPSTYTLMATNAHDHMRIKPWWTQLSNPELRACIFDVPKVSPCPGVNGIQILEWGAKSPADNPRSDPPELVAEFKRRYGIHQGSLLDEDITESPAYFRRLLHALLESVRLRTRICLDLMQQEDWDLFVHVFSETHSVGHRFMHFFEGDKSRGLGHDLAELRDAVRLVYQEVDRGIGIIRAAAPDNATLISCAMHGMGLNENSEVSELLPELLRRYSSIEGTGHTSRYQQARSKLFLAAHTLTPGIVRDKVKHRMSQGMRKRLRMERQRRIHDQQRWQDMKAFSLPSDEGGFVRINLRGREPGGRVLEEEYQQTIAELVDIFLELYDPSTGTPAVRRVRRVAEQQTGEHLAALPDLVVEWSEESLRELASPRFGHLGRYHPHRAGTHRPRGYFTACGPGVSAGTVIEGGSVFDIPPSILSLLGEPMQSQCVGRPLL
ncbi:MAG: alkaline phosphatase family protein [Pseudomonadota bacterium]